jgi:hypothetical protein
MTQKNLGCLSAGGLVSAIVSAAVVFIAFLVSGSQMFSPGDLNDQGLGRRIDGLLSHAEIGQECQYCHPSPWDSFDQSDLCLDCHQEIRTDLADRKSLHGAARTIQNSNDCRGCHSEHLGAQSNLTEYSGENFPHNLLDFSIKAHLEIDWVQNISCSDCHPVSFLKIDDSVCTDCHSNFDKVNFIVHTDNYGKRCLYCHDGLESINSSYDHNLTDLPLTGEHQKVTCADCHSGMNSVREFQAMDISCWDCHIDQDVHQKFLGIICEDCHEPSGWKEADYDHTETGFPLEGGHSSLICADCHPDQTYQGQDENCLSCHQEDDLHQGIFGEDCTICHTTNNWTELIFDHTGPYAGLCSTCHQADNPVNHYPAQCSACHTTNAWLPATFSHTAMNTNNCQSCHLPDRPSNHFIGQCSICHSKNKWIPAFISHTFPVNHEGANNRCNLCHPGNNYSNYNCYQCHEHNSSEVKKEHKEISNLNNCIRCHWDGNKHDDDDDDDD